MKKISLFVKDVMTNTITNMKLIFNQKFFCDLDGLIWFVGFYGISTFVGYLMPNPFVFKQSVLFKTIQFIINTYFNSKKHFYFKIFKLSYVTIQLSVNTVLM